MLQESEHMREKHADIVIKSFALCGIIAAFMDIVIITILGELLPHYNPLEQTASELGATGGSYSVIISVWWLVYGLLIVAFAYGLNMGIVKAGAVWWMGMLLIAVFGVFDGIGSGVFQCDPGCLGKTLIGKLHLVVSVIGTSALLPAPFFVWLRMCHDERWRGYRTFTITIQGVAIVLSILFLCVEIPSCNGILKIKVGLLQRIFLSINYLWIVVLAVHLFHTAGARYRLAK
jgi:hypothetical protein